MPTNPQVPREVAEARGKGAGVVAVLGISLAAIGVIALMVVMSIASSTSGSVERAQVVAPEQMAPTSVDSQGGNYPLCADAKDVFFYPDRGMTKVRVPMRRDCWSGWISTPIDWDWEFETVERKGADVWFRDGERKWFGPNDTTRWLNRRGVFRVRGEGDIVAWIHDGPEDKERKRLEDEAVRTGRPRDPNAVVGGKRPFPELVQEEIATVVATNFLENLMTVKNENGERNINPHNNPLYVKAPNGSWQYSMWWHLEAGDKIRLVWNGDQLQRMELFENVRDKKNDQQQNPTALKTTPPKPASQIPQLILAEVVEINPLENFIVVQTDQGQQEIHPHNAPLYVKAPNGSWQIAMMSSLEAGDKVRLVWRDEDPSELRRIELVENVRTANRQ